MSQLDNTPKTEREVRILMHEPAPEQRPPASRATCPCGYSEVVEPVWAPYLNSHGWKLTWYFGVKCPKHGWASRLKAVPGRPGYEVNGSNGDILDQ
jgi:hypothetical protein